MFKNDGNDSLMDTDLMTSIVATALGKSKNDGVWKTAAKNALSKIKTKEHQLFDMIKGVEKAHKITFE